MSNRYRAFKCPRSEAVDNAWRMAVIDDLAQRDYKVMAWCATVLDANRIVDALNRAERRRAVLAAGMGRNPLRRKRA